MSRMVYERGRLTVTLWPLRAWASSVAAFARGACIVEKHITIDQSWEGPDHAASTDPANFRRMVRGIRMAEAALGDGVKVPTPGEAKTAAVARRRDGLRRSA